MRNGIAQRFPVLAGVLLALLVLAVLFAEWTSAWAFPRFVLATVLLIWLPGHFVLHVLRVRTGGIEALALAFVLGMLTSSIIYWFLMLVGAPWLIVVWVLLAGVSTVRGDSIRRRLAGPSPALRWEHALLGAIVGAGCALFVLLPDYWRNFSERPDGSLRMIAYDDIVFHVSLTRELTHSVPPDVPYLSGQPLTYHYGMDLVSGMMAKFARVSALDVTVRFMPLLFLLATALATYAFARAWLRSSGLAVLAAALVLFGEDLSFIFGLLKHSHDYWRVQYFEVPAVYSLFAFNPMAISVGILMAGLLALYRWLDGGSRSWALTAGFMMGMLWEFKVFLAQLAFAALALGSIIEYTRFRSGGGRRLPTVLAAGLAVALPLALYTVFGTELRGITSVSAAHHPYVTNALKATGFRIDELTGGFVRLILLLVVGLPFYFLFNLGMRLVAVPALLSRRLRLPTPPSMRLFALLFVAVGVALTFVARITLKTDPQGGYDNAVWFYVGTKYLLWILALEVVMVVWMQGWRRTAGVLASLILLLSLPSTIQFVHRSRQLLSYKGNRQGELRLMRDLDRRCSGGTVVVPDPQLLRAMVTLTDCATPAPGHEADFFAPSLATGAELRRRVDAVRSFWTGWTHSSCDSSIAARFRIRYVVAAVDLTPPSQCRSSRVVSLGKSGRFITYGLDLAG